MVELLESTLLGPYLLTRMLEPCAVAERHLALHDSDHSSHVAYRFAIPNGSRAWRRLQSALAACRAVGDAHEHLLAIDDVREDEDGDGGVWAICPFTGDVDGVRTLSKLLREKRGQMDPFEAERAMVQLLEAMVHTHPQLVHGALSMDEILVDRHGRLLIEFYGVRAALAGARPDGHAEMIRDEVRSVVEIGYQLITGLRAEEPMIPAGRLVKRLDPALDRWLTKGLNHSGGFSTAAQALAELPSRAFESHIEVEEPRSWGGWSALANVRTVLGRLRSVRG